MWNSFRDCPKKAGNEAVVCVAGLASGALATKYSMLGQYQISYCAMTALSQSTMQTLSGLKLVLTEGRLRDGRKVPCTRSRDGIDVRPVQGTAGISTLNPGEKIPIPVWKGLMDPIQDLVNFHAFNYDWRRWGDRVYAEQLVSEFRETVEESVSPNQEDGWGAGQLFGSDSDSDESNDEKKATVVAHSMGASVVLYCLSVLGDDWVKRYVSQVILVAPAHMGSPSMLPSYAYGPVGTTADSMIPAPAFVGDRMGNVCARWACMIAEMPVQVGEASPWPADYPLAFTPERTYTLADMGQFLKDVAKHKTKRDFGPALFPGVREIASKMKAPAVPTRILYSDATDTIAQVEYDSADVSAPAKVRTNEPGDGTIIASSIERVAQHWMQSGAEVTLHKVPGGISHKDLIACDFTVDFLEQSVVGSVSARRRSEQRAPPQFEMPDFDSTSSDSDSD